MAVESVCHPALSIIVSGGKSRLNRSSVVPTMNERALNDLNSELLFNSTRSVSSIFLVTLGSRRHDLFMSVYGPYDIGINVQKTTPFIDKLW